MIKKFITLLVALLLFVVFLFKFAPNFIGLKLAATKSTEIDYKGLRATSDIKAVGEFTPSAPSLITPENLLYTTKSDESLGEIINAYSNNPQEAQAIIAALLQHKELVHLESGVKIEFIYEYINDLNTKAAASTVEAHYGRNTTTHKLPNSREQIIKAVNISLNPLHEIMAEHVPKTNSFITKVRNKKSELRLVLASSNIESSLFNDGVNGGVPAPVMLDLIGDYSYDVDLQRDITKGSKLNVVYEAYYTNDGEKISEGRVVYSSLKLKDRTIKIYRIRRADGTISLVNEKGESIKKSLLRTPINGAKITSGFGVRTHPLLGYSLIHKGIDFGAPTGTPILAAGAGVVVKAHYNGNYGNYVQIKHDPRYSTAYAHASRFASGVKVGAKVKQGQVIAFVGTTGRSTGAHLHYEILLNGSQVNPASVKIATRDRLEGKEMARLTSLTKLVRDGVLSHVSGNNWGVAANYEKLSKDYNANSNYKLEL